MSSYYTYVTFNDIKTNFTPLGYTFNIFDNSSIVSDFISAGLIDSASRLTSIFMRRYATRYYYNLVLINNNSIDYETLYNTIKNNIADIDYELKWKYEKLIATLNFEYNPIWNKDGTITHTSTRTPDLTTTDNGNNSNKLTHGLSTKTEYNDATTTVTHGLETSVKHGLSTALKHGLSTETTPGASTKVHIEGTSKETPGVSDTTTNSISPYNNTSSVEHDKSVLTHNGENITTNSSDTTTSYISGTDTTTNSGTDTTTNSGTDTTTNSGDDITTLKGGYTVSNSGDDNSTSTNSNTRQETGTDKLEESTTEQGNIGVTSTQSLIKQEREISDFRILDEYLKDIVRYISLSTYKIVEVES